jgi:hypothetical protein
MRNQWAENNHRWVGHLNKDRLALSYEAGASLSDIAKSEGVSIGTVFRRFKAYSIPTDPIRRKTKEGARIIRDGYVWVKVKDHPYANYGGYVKEHRLVVEKRLGRYLLPEEKVHHEDENTLNNVDRNLGLSSDSSHKSYHATKRTRDNNGRFMK